MVSAELAQKLLQIKAIKLSPSEPFTWASGIKSPIYCDNRITLSYPEIRTFVKIALSTLSEQLEDYDTVAGVATAGIAHGALIADYIKKPFIYVRSKAKGHGRENLIEGDFSRAKKVLVVEDLISTGGSSIQAVEALRAEGIEVVGVIALFSYEFEKAKKNFEAANCPYLTVSGYSTMLTQAKKTNYITDEEYATLQDWSKDPSGWFDTNFK
ncbi:MAG TPA: orotate phosphoribosyltransferase [Saprospirales bacterium]|jgi:orotate phosphoribosyltransferase|nr:orotate phosphoribosyltransferase [Saprospiraceae bacterium]HAV30081.1 orotate phosphoribosyltransferase [Saprospirales bacterium]HAW04154.1 orotate phosphoribosyltransferase [Saprospirales bacterium]